METIDDKWSYTAATFMAAIFQVLAVCALWFGNSWRFFAGLESMTLFFLLTAITAVIQNNLAHSE